MPERASNSFPRQDELKKVISQVAKEANAYLNDLKERPVRSQEGIDHLSQFDTSLPEVGVGASAALRELVQQGIDGAIATTGPRCFHFVIGGTTPAALGADWLTTTLDQMAYAWVSSPLAVELELVSLRWLKELLGIPAEWAGIITTGATMANFACLASARQWWGRQHDVDIADKGIAGLPPIPILSGGYLHASARKALAMLGLGRSTPQIYQLETTGMLDLASLAQALRGLKGQPALIIATAGEVNAGHFDPIAELAELARDNNAWLHVDGAFGLFARVSPQTQPLIAGVDHAHSVAFDGHKWLNVPYDCGFAFVSDPTALAGSFTHSAAYLPRPDDPEPVLGALGPEMSRRARSLSVWATLRAYGRYGYRQMVEGHLALAQRLAGLVDDAPDLERLAEVPLNIVCFRYNPGGQSEERLNEINQALGAAILKDGRIYAGTTLYGSRVALRPAIVNWRTQTEDIDLLVHVVRELGARLVSSE